MVLERDLCIHELFERQVHRRPNAVALTDGERHVTYAALNTAADEVAQRLIAHGTQVESRIGLCAGRGAELVIGVLGILKAGAGYVPLDPSYPAQRLDEIVADAEPMLVLVDSEGAKALSTSERRVPLLMIDGAVEKPVFSGRRAGLSSRHVSHVIYTSGSSGKPKGVLVEHRHVVSLYEATDVFFGFNEHDVWCLFHSFAFDFSVWEIWGALAYGGRLVIVPRAIARSAPDLHKLVCDTGVTVLNQTPSAFKAFVEAQTRSASSTQLRYVILGGEVVDRSLVKRWHDAFGSASAPPLINIYGPTETTVFVTCARLSPTADVVTIGRPISNSYVRLLDSNRREVAPGACGEIYIGGGGVSRGYLNRPALTAERFVPDPYSDDSDVRLYRTGDMARQLPSGEFDFLGRCDDQIKLRGYRIEPGEIEARLVEHESIREASVIVREDTHGEKRLIAYVVTTQDSTIHDIASELHALLSKRLPVFMIPAAFVRLDKLPLTQNGKVDRQALPPVPSGAIVQRAYQSPKDEHEQIVVDSWEELVSARRVGRNDNFFEIGGHSLLAVRMVNSLAERLGIDLPVSSVFHNPTVSAFAGELARLRKASNPALPAIRAVARTGLMPLSFAQQRLWFLSKLEGVSEGYHIDWRFRFRGPLDVAAWQKSLDMLVARHEVLRSVIVEEGGQPHVKVLPLSCGFPLKVWLLESEEDPECTLRQLLDDEARVPFELSGSVFCRGHLFRLGPEHHVFALTQHHIATDGWSLGLMARELSALYAGLSTSHSHALPEIGIQYSDFATWQHEWMTPDHMWEHAEYWRKTLESAPLVVSVPSQRTPSLRRTYVGGSVEVQLDVDLTQRLNELSRKQDVTLFMTLLSAWAGVVSRLAGQDDITIGVPFANRQRQSLESLLGFFVNTLPIRIQLSGQPSAIELLARVRRAAIGAQEHQDLPFEQIVEILQPERRLDRTPIFQIVFAWQNNEPGTLKLPNIDVKELPSPSRAKFDLELHLNEVGGRIVGHLVFATDLFDAAFAERCRGYLLAMLHGMLDEPTRPVAAIEILDAEERQLLVSDWNPRSSSDASAVCVHEAFERQVERAPSATAVVDNGNEISYAELNNAANAVARSLLNFGIKSGDCVATLFDRSASLVVAQLAILKVGAVYVPLDVRAPDARNAWMLSDCEAKLLVASRDRTSPVPSIRTLHFEHDFRPVDDIRVTTSADAPAYVMYTSGSTGVPKGVVIPHKGISRLVLKNGFAELARDDRAAWVGSPSFDISTFEVWAPLLNGATLVVICQEHVLAPERMTTALEQHNVNVLFLTTGLFHQVADVLGDSLRRLRLLLVGGDLIDPTIIRRVVHQYRPERVLHCYGPTESTTIATAYEVVGDVDSVRVPIGRPISQTQVYILDEYQHLVPRGAIGEIYIGGTGLASEYLNRSDLTKERFVRDPFTSLPGARLYRTGDMARHMSDGNIEFLGRTDLQVKIRGYRIELGEIEARLAEVEGVREAVVVVVGDDHDRRLLAYFTVRDDFAGVDITRSLREHLARTLPQYMLPSRFTRLDSLPLTPNGKVDRKLLASRIVETNEGVYDAPQGDMEKTVAKVWEELLGVKRISRHDNFFELGGHSLLAVRLVSRLQRDLRVEVKISEVFSSPILSQFSRRVLINLLGQVNADELHRLVLEETEGTKNE